MIPHLPPDIIAEVLPYLNLKDLLRCKTVCKEWQTLIQEVLAEDPNFSNNFMMRKPKTYTCHYIPCSAIHRKKKNTWLLATCNGLDVTLERSQLTTLSLAILDMWGFLLGTQKLARCYVCQTPSTTKLQQEKRVARRSHARKQRL